MAKTKYNWRYWTIRDRVNDLTRRLMIQGERLKIEAQQPTEKKKQTDFNSEQSSGRIAKCWMDLINNPDCADERDHAIEYLSSLNYDTPPEWTEDNYEHELLKEEGETQ